MEQRSAVEPAPEKDAQQASSPLSSAANPALEAMRTVSGEAALAAAAQLEGSRPPASISLRPPPDSAQSVQPPSSLPALRTYPENYSILFCKHRDHLAALNGADASTLARYSAQARERKDTYAEGIFRIMLYRLDSQNPAPAQYTKRARAMPREPQLYTQALQGDWDCISTGTLVKYSMQAADVRDFESVVALQQILAARDPDRPVAHVVLANTLMKLNPPRPRAAIAAFERALELPTCEHRDRIGGQIKSILRGIKRGALREESGGVSAEKSASRAVPSSIPPSAPPAVLAASAIQQRRFEFKSAINARRFDEFLQSLADASKTWEKATDKANDSAKKIPAEDAAGISEYMAHMGSCLRTFIPRKDYRFWDAFDALRKRASRGILVPEIVLRLIGALPPGIHWENIR